MTDNDIRQMLECENPLSGSMFLWDSVKEARREYSRVAEALKSESARRGLQLFDAYHAFYQGELQEAEKLAWQVFKDVSDKKEDDVWQLQHLGAAYLIEQMARHGMDYKKRKEADSCIARLANDYSASPLCREAAQIYRAMSCMALAMLSEVPVWIRNKEFGVCRVNQKLYYGEESLDSHNLPAAILASIQYFSYVGKPVQALNTIEEFEQLYKIPHNRIFDTYLAVYRAWNYQQLQLEKEEKQTLLKAAELASRDGLWLILAEFEIGFGEILIEAAAEYSAEGADRIRYMSNGFLERTQSLHRVMEAQNHYKPLTNREREIMYLIADGLSDKEIAERIHLAKGTVKYHTRNAYEKLGVDKNVKIKDALEIRDVRAIWLEK